MGIEIRPAGIKAMASSMTTSLRDQINGLNGVLPPVRSFGGASLAGAAWTKAKNKLSYHPTIVEGMKCGNESLLIDCQKLSEAVGSEDLIEDDIREIIRTQDGLIDRWSSDIASYKRKMQNTDSLLQKAYYAACIGRLQTLIACANLIMSIQKTRLARMESIVAKTNPLFSEGTELLSASKNAMGALASWDGSGMPPLSLLMYMDTLEGLLASYYDDGDSAWNGEPGVFFEGSDEDRQKILDELNLLTDHELDFVDGQLVIVQYGTTNDFPDGNALIEKLLNTEMNCTIQVVTGSDGSNVMPFLDDGRSINDAWLAHDYVYEEGKPYHARVYIDFGAQPGLLERDWETMEVGYSTAPMHIILAHELIHADRVMTGNTSDDGLIAHFFEEPTLNKGPIKYVEGVPAEELYASGIETEYTPISSGQITENSIRKEQGLDERIVYTPVEQFYNLEQVE